MPAQLSRLGVIGRKGSHFLRGNGAVHLLGWLALCLIFFLQSPGLTAADTKLDLVADPTKFLHDALSAYTDTFTLGQLQNQAYGYLFPQGFFFLLAGPLPDWVAQRLWWTLVCGIGFSGFLALSRRLGVGTPVFQVVAASLYALSPHTLTTLGAISSETWPAMLAPWILLPFLGPKVGRAQVAASVIGVACLGAVNATATLAACVPAGVALLFYRRFKALAAWLGGCLLVSSWWIVPLVVLARYSSPFTDYIESAGVTTRWLNLAEILRGTTSWAPFVDSERIAGNALVTSPYFVVATLIVAGAGLVGLGKSFPRHAFFVALLGIGIFILGGAHLATTFLDGTGSALRNVHKFDLLVRLPLAVGVAALGPSIASVASASKKATAMALCIVFAVGATAPAFNRVLPQGAYQQIPDYWKQAAEFINANAVNTRTLILPSSSFARQTWGWTRDEPAQALLVVPWAVRDAIPLVDPEAIRGLDGLTEHPTEDNLTRMGIGAIIVRHDLSGNDVSTASYLPEADVQSFGDVDVVLLNPKLSMLMTQQVNLPTVAGGGEILSLLGAGSYQLTGGDADIVTDTPALVARNYGTLGSVSAPLASTSEGKDVLNPVKDYPSVGPMSVVSEVGHVSASSSASDATSFGGAVPSESITSAVDGNDQTAWYPTPGTQQGQWIEVTPDQFPARTITIETTGDTVELEVSAGQAHVSAVATPREPLTLTVPGDVNSPVRITLGASKYRVGISEVSFAEGTVSRVLTVPDTSPNVSEFLFQRVLSGEKEIVRSFSAPRDMTVSVSPSECFREVLIDDQSYRCGDDVQLAHGQHTLRTLAQSVKLTVPGFDDSGTPNDVLTLGDDGKVKVDASDHDRLLVTTRSVNSGLRGYIETGGGEVALEARTVNAGSQAFVVPAGTSGYFRMTFAGNRPYRWGLLLGAVVGFLTVAVCLLLVDATRRRPSAEGELHPDSGPEEVVAWLLVALGCVASIGWPAVIVALAMWAIHRFTIIPRALMTSALAVTAAMWLARAPWPSAHYAGGSLLLGLVCAGALLGATLPRAWLARNAATIPETSGPVSPSD
ncbi:alpha-(1-_3)-arabinofuranosyltransferase domain-containing protein [Corynebacterium vitaeruminis]|uniref:alpha-(1->3)-arabinofuranosyltransferase domain-containing protein n=1 Tax=Corynebacterium vitaeruminis TaxID=38305 RepID=UPI0023F38DCB|nr:alpha-(1->3)-arabinofuranosyltransferase family protein [Corynebacterium vitaeruminis]